ncbi:MAG: DUF6482 family protein [Marinobacter sp.]|nr:DUF6482 family protein [Marinobacter sp.]
MRISLAQLRDLADPHIELLEIISLEGQRYMARLYLDGQPLILSNDANDTLLLRSSWEVRDLLGSFSIRRTDVVHPSAYNEMVGLSAQTVAPLRIKVGEA